jgi:hypothetical protein
MVPPVLVFLSSKLAVGIALPLASVTVPLSVARVSCPCSEHANRRVKAITCRRKPLLTEDNIADPRGAPLSSKTILRFIAIGLGHGLFPTGSGFVFAQSILIASFNVLVSV